MIREQVARNFCTPSIFHLINRTEAEKAVYRAERAELLAHMLEEIRLDYEVGPPLGPGRREWYTATRGQRSVEQQSGRPGKLAWRRPRG